MVSIAVVGTGYWGKNHLRNYKQMLDAGKIDLLKVCDRAPDVARAHGEANSIPYCTDHREVLEDSRINAVSIVTPTPTHFALVADFLRAGKDVLVEKPMTMSSEEGEELVKIAEAHKRVLMVGHIFRHHRAVRKIKRMMRKGEMGKVYYLESNRTDFALPQKGMGVLLDLAIHEVDMFCYLMDREYPDFVHAIVESYLRGGPEETANITLGFPDKVKAYAFESYMTPVFGKKRELIVVGEKKSVTMDYLKPDEITVFNTSVTPVPGNGGLDYAMKVESKYKTPIDYREPLEAELSNFIDCVQSREMPRSDMYSGLRAVKIIELVQQSVNEGRTIPIEK